MHAKPGDRIIIKGHRSESLTATARFSRSVARRRTAISRSLGDSGHTGLLFPGADALVQEFHRGK